jgi:excisionase family DNA binding protein
VTSDRFAQAVAQGKRLIETGRHEDSVTVVVAAAVLEVTTDCVYRYVRDGVLKAHRFGRLRKRIRIPCDELHRFVHGDRVTRQGLR